MRPSTSKQQFTGINPTLLAECATAAILLGHLPRSALLLGCEQFDRVYGKAIGLQGAQNIARGQRRCDDLDARVESRINVPREGMGAFFV